MFWRSKFQNHYQSLSSSWPRLTSGFRFILSESSVSGCNIASVSSSDSVIIENVGLSFMTWVSCKQKCSWFLNFTYDGLQFDYNLPWLAWTKVNTHTPISIYNNSELYKRPKNDLRFRMKCIPEQQDYLPKHQIHIWKIFD